MSVETRELIEHEPGGRLGNTPEEKFVSRAAKTTTQTADVVITLGNSRGWRFRCRTGDKVALWQPAAGDTAITYTLTNAALWRAIKRRGASLT